MRKDTETEKEMKKVVDELLPTVLNGNTLYNAFLGLTNIEKAKQEDYVIKEMVKGTKKSQILSYLNDNYPEYVFTYPDLDKFLAKNPEIFRALGKKVESSAIRYLNAKADVMDRMAGLIAYTENLVTKLENQGDNTNTVGAIRALQNSYMDMAKLQGFLKDDGKSVNVNIVQQLDSRRDSTRKVIDADYDIEDNNE